MQTADRVEEIVHRDDRVEISRVRLYSPLPQNDPPHPAAVDWISYLRYRCVGAPERSEDHDAILLIQPGNFGGAQSLDGVARCVLLEAAARGRSVEFWALARRSQSADDPTGFEAALAAGDPDIAFEYYFGGAEVDGKRFEGFGSGARMAFLADFGWARIAQDLREVFLREIPDPEVRRAKAFLGGHSGGSSLTAAFGSWDFDGTPGHEMCRGYIALDTPLDCDFGTRSNTAVRALSAPARAAGGLAYRGVVAATRKGRSPRSHGRLLAMASYTWRLLALYAYLTPEADGTLIQRIEAALSGTEGARQFRALSRVVGSTTWRQALTGRPDPVGLQLTCAAEAGMWMGRGTTALPVMISCGSLDGPVRPRNFPVPSGLWRVPALKGLVWAVFGYAPLTAPADPAHRYGWKSEESAVGDLHDVARAMIAGFEPYHTPRYLIDQAFALVGVRAGDLAAIRHERGMRAKPLVSIFEGHMHKAPAMKFMNLGDAHVMAGYSHIDVVSGSPRADGSPDPVAVPIVDFVLGTVGAGGSREVSDFVRRKVG
ncbi:hypothetical protein JK358_34920 [Nocardia sp. 2]|uniref:Alpha/beta hydrolase n=1 Tax=Nocardia acididurans TaxID=2802282 RepID=A0ABS1MG20_9NOCA|nr:hypothetical protein [Nocardia acididurans]MBL1079610.1 hypothetical protein [Nocardia acididurans]